MHGERSDEKTPIGAFFSAGTRSRNPARATSSMACSGGAGWKSPKAGARGSVRRESRSENLQQGLGCGSPLPLSIQTQRLLLLLNQFLQFAVVNLARPELRQFLEVLQFARDRQVRQPARVDRAAQILQRQPRFVAHRDQRFAFV